MNSDRSFIFVIALALVGAVIIGAIIIVSLSQPAPEDETTELAAENTSAADDDTSVENGEATAEPEQEANSSGAGEATETVAQQESGAEESEAPSESDMADGNQQSDESSNEAATPTSASRVTASSLIGTQSTIAPPATIAVTQSTQTDGSTGQATPTSLSRVSQSIILGAAPQQTTAIATAAPEEIAETTEAVEASAEATEAAETTAEATESEAPVEATEQANGAEGGEFLSFDEANQTVTLTIIAAYNNTNGGLNFNGYANGNARVSVPQGWTVNVQFDNRSNIPHSVVLVPRSAVRDTILPQPLFEGAASEDYEGGTTSASAFSFIAEEEGSYAFACGVAGHAAQGQWIIFEVGPADSQPYYEANG